MTNEEQYVYLENTKDGHNKWYEISRKETRVRIRYGPIGRILSVSEQSFETEEQAQKFMEKQTYKKIITRDYEVKEQKNFTIPVVFASVTGILDKANQ